MKKWMLAVLEIALLGGAVYWLIQYSPSSHIPTTQPATSNKTPFASIDASTLNVVALSPINITGTCGNISGAMAIAIVPVEISLSSYALPSYPDVAVFRDYTDHDGQFEASCKAVSGTFNTRYSSPKLQKGIYTVGIYLFENVYTDQGYQQNARVKLLTSATLTVK